MLENTSLIWLPSTKDLAVSVDSAAHVPDLEHAITVFWNALPNKSEVKEIFRLLVAEEVPVPPPYEVFASPKADNPAHCSLKVRDNVKQREGANMPIKRLRAWMRVTIASYIEKTSQTY